MPLICFLFHQQVLLLSRSVGLQPVLKPDHNKSGVPSIRFAGEVSRNLGKQLFRDKKLQKVNAYMQSAAAKDQKMRRTENRNIVVKKIIRKEIQTVYGVDVAENHNFITSGGLIIHNCIPLAPQYVLEGAQHPEQLTLMQESLKTDFSQPDKVVESVLKRGVQKVALLGIAYTGDLKVHVLSPALPLARKLKEKGIDIKVHDPYYTDEEIMKLTGCESFVFPEGLHDRDGIIIVSPHMQYRYVHKQELLGHLSSTRLILDNMGAWNDVSFPENIRYFEAGHPHWLGK